VGTNNAINLNQAGLANYNGSGSFTAVTVPADQVLTGGAGNTITGINPTGFDPGNPICSTGVGTPPAFSASPVVDKITINNLPVNPTDGANKNYVDLVAGSFTFLDSTVCGSTVNLSANYNNGAAGVGATLTNTGTLAAIQLDGYSPLSTNRVLIKNQTNAYENGVYTVTTVGNGTTAWVLTRATDYDTPAEITPGSLVSVLYGNTQSNTFWAETQTVTNVGVDPIQFIQFSVVPSGVLLAANNLNDVNSASASRTNLGLTNIATQNTTEYAVLAGGASDGVTSLSLGSTGQFLTSQGAGAYPIWTSGGGGGGGIGFAQVNVQVFTSSGTYTPSANMLYCIVELVGGGGGGGGSLSTTYGGVGAGGGGGGYSRKLLSAASIGASQTVTIGAGGNGGTPGNSGGNGSSTLFGSIFQANGGNGGTSTPGGAGTSVIYGATGGTATGGDINIVGSSGGSASYGNSVAHVSGYGGFSIYGGSAPQVYAISNPQNRDGFDGLSYGGGGSGSSSYSSGSNNTGGAGADGVCIITEFIGNNSPFYTYTLVTNADSPYTVLSGDYYLSVDSTAGAVTILLPDSSSTGRNFIIKDKAGTSATNNITITTVSGTTLIDGATSLTMQTNYQSINLIFDGASYEVF
jgi:hypothetical protein